MQTFMSVVTRLLVAVISPALAVLLRKNYRLFALGVIVELAIFGQIHWMIIPIRVIGLLSELYWQYQVYLDTIYVRDVLAARAKAAELATQQAAAQLAAQQNGRRLRPYSRRASATAHAYQS